ncbi:MAG: porin family protein [Cyanothece sp. SIO2G6]|nr:porin family protein [Cyanothece sp. SIO2G6]
MVNVKRQGCIGTGSGWRGGAIASICGLTAALITLCSATPATAQAAYGSYVGVGASIGLTDGNETFGENQDEAITIAARYHFLRLPLSVRAQALVFTDTNALVPTVSYDFPLNWNTDLYFGAGLAIQDADDNEDPSPIGNRTAFVLQPGVDYMLPNSHLVVFGNAIIAFDAYRESDNAAAALQGGVGVRF